MAIAIENSRDGKVYFAVTVSKARAEYLFQCLQRPLCTCGREVDECEADPCDDRRVNQGELAYCAGCHELFDPAAIDERGKCPECRSLT